MTTHKDVVQHAKEQAKTIKQDERDLKEHYATLTKRVELLFKKKKKYLKERKELVRPAEPIVFLIRKYGDVEIYEGVKGDTFIIPPAKVESDKMFQWGDTTTQEKQGQRKVYFTGRDVKRIHWGDDYVKGYFVHEDDAMPIGCDPKVFSERLEYTIDSILLNFEKFKRKNEGGMDWLPKMVLYAGIAVALYFVARGLFPEQVPALPGMGETAKTVIEQTASNISGIQIIS